MAARKARKEKILDVAVGLIAEKGWLDLSLSELAQVSEVSLDQLHDAFRRKNDILWGLQKRLDAATLKEIELEDLEGEPARDRLFDVLMTRFEVMEPYKYTLEVISEDLLQDPRALVGWAHNEMQSLRWLLDAAGLGTRGFSGLARLHGLAAIWAECFRTWLKEGPDMPQTMALLDQRLAKGEKWMRRGQKYLPF
ncbi:MAG: AcrR family transcriptional regulator [Parvibaculaceae bacterium]|jgi:ubiquinone biosynthesis protein COQ9